MKEGSFYSACVMCCLWAGGLLVASQTFKIGVYTSLAILFAGIASAIILFRGLLKPEPWICPACLDGICEECYGNHCSCIMRDKNDSHR